MRHSPAADRNKQLISDVLKDHLPSQGKVLEVASGTGQHIVYFAEQFPNLQWIPSDPSQESLKSIQAYRNETGAKNIEKALNLDVLVKPWPSLQVQFILNINMLHISPPSTTQALFEKASKLLEKGQKLFIYGPFIEKDVPTAPSNLEFNQFLKSKNSQFGIRDLNIVKEAGLEMNFQLDQRIAMPANNLSLVFSKTR